MPLDTTLDPAIARRAALCEAPHESAFRLWNGFTEGEPSLALDVYADALVVHDYADPARDELSQAKDAAALALARLPWLRTALWKAHADPDHELRRGTLLHGTAEELPRSVREDGVLYAVDLRLHGDASLYLDTRNLRAWLRRELADRRVLNTFAYTGSLGVAARAGGAEVLHVDRDGAFLEIARRSYALNHWAVRRRDFRAVDFFPEVRRLRREDQLFDAVIVDPPFFSTTERGRVDLETGLAPLLNKVRPLVGDGGFLVAVNNGLFVSGRRYLEDLERLCADGYLTLAETIPVPEDFVGAGGGAWPADPAPFNHPTKIAILRARRKDGRRAPPVEARGTG